MGSNPIGIAMNNRDKELDAFERLERAGVGYRLDPRWEEVTRLRSTSKPDDVSRANHIVSLIRSDWGID